MDLFSSNGLVIAGALIIIVSYLFNLVARRYSIPSVLLLIGLGVILKVLVEMTGMQVPGLTPILEVLGTIGLIMIVLEASLDLELEKGKRKLVALSFFTSLTTLVVSAFAVGGIMMVYLNVDLSTGLLYAIPLSIMSSAIVIPSVSALNEKKREFMVYESTFSDILGIMLFYFLISTMEAESVGQMGLEALLNLSLSMLVSVGASYLLILLFQRIRTAPKLFLLIAVLILLYGISKIFHLSSLLIILVFGLMLSNRHIFFPGRMAHLLEEEQMASVYRDFKLITLESSFVVRTFFFVIFGFTIALAALLKLEVWLVSILIIIALYGIRFAWFRLVVRRDIYPDIWLAPRGLITILLFYSIPKELAVEGFNEGVLLLVILATSIIMAISLIRYRKSARAQETSAVSPENATADPDNEADRPSKVVDLEP